eukprot:GEMP01001089.1.p1 GENE.GEMP01001089.1~~GEMP01001089.1.p1  ORF type:complete len:1296 (+),score=236.37 GEMP01001089.1:48-3935(+)
MDNKDRDSPCRGEATGFRQTSEDPNTITSFLEEAQYAVKQDSEKKQRTKRALRKRILWGREQLDTAAPVFDPEYVSSRVRSMSEHLGRLEDPKRFWHAASEVLNGSFVIALHFQLRKESSRKEYLLDDDTHDESERSARKYLPSMLLLACRIASPTSPPCPEIFTANVQDLAKRLCRNFCFLKDAMRRFLELSIESNEKQLDLVNALAISFRSFDQMYELFERKVLCKARAFAQEKAQPFWELVLSASKVLEFSHTDDHPRVVHTHPSCDNITPETPWDLMMNKWSFTWLEETTMLSHLTRLTTQLVADVWIHNCGIASTDHVPFWKSSTGGVEFTQDTLKNIKNDDYMDESRIPLGVIIIVRAARRHFEKVLYILAPLLPEPERYPPSIFTYELGIKAALSKCALSWHYARTCFHTLPVLQRAHSYVNARQYKVMRHLIETQDTKAASIFVARCIVLEEILKGVTIPEADRICSYPNIPLDSQFYWQYATRKLALYTEDELERFRVQLLCPHFYENIALMFALRNHILESYCSCQFAFSKLERKVQELGYDDFKYAVNNFVMELSEDKIERLFDLIDENNSEEISVEEFVNALESPELIQPKMCVECLTTHRPAFPMKTLLHSDSMSVGHVVSALAAHLLLFERDDVWWIGKVLSLPFQAESTEEEREPFVPLTSSFFEYDLMLRNSTRGKQPPEDVLDQVWYSTSDALPPSNIMRKEILPRVGTERNKELTIANSVLGKFLQPKEEVTRRPAKAMVAGTHFTAFADRDMDLMQYIDRIIGKTDDLSPLGVTLKPKPKFILPLASKRKTFIVENQISKATTMPAALPSQPPSPVLVEDQAAAQAAPGEDNTIPPRDISEFPAPKSTTDPPDPLAPVAEPPFMAMQSWHHTTDSFNSAGHCMLSVDRLSSLGQRHNFPGPLTMSHSFSESSHRSSPRLCVTKDHYGRESDRVMQAHVAAMRRPRIPFYSQLLGPQGGTLRKWMKARHDAARVPFIHCSRRPPNSYERSKSGMSPPSSMSTMGAISPSLAHHSSLPALIGNRELHYSSAHRKQWERLISKKTSLRTRNRFFSATASTRAPLSPIGTTQPRRATRLPRCPKGNALVRPSTTAVFSPLRSSSPLPRVVNMNQATAVPSLKRPRSAPGLMLSHAATARGDCRLRTPSPSRASVASVNINAGVEFEFQHSSYGRFGDSGKAKRTPDTKQIETAKLPRVISVTKPCRSNMELPQKTLITSAARKQTSPQRQPRAANVSSDMRNSKDVSCNAQKSRHKLKKHSLFISPTRYVRRQETNVPAF